MKTSIDALVGLLLQNGKKITVREAAAKLRWDEKAIEKVALMLEQGKVLQLDYPVNPLESITLHMLEEKSTEKKVPLKAINVREKYTLDVDGVPAEVYIYESKEDRTLQYYIDMPTLSPYTWVVIEQLKDEIIKKVPVEVELITDVERASKISKAFYQNILDVLRQYNFPPNEKSVIGGILLHEMNGLGEIEMLVADDWLEEIIINSASIPIGIYHRKYGWLKTNIFIKSEEKTVDYASYIGRKVGRNISTLTPILDAHLLTGDRVNSTLYPISTKGNTITVRKFARNPWTIINFISPELNTMSVDMAAFLWQAIQYEMNVIFAGGTASGKTTALNSLACFIQPFHRVISIEDTREIVLPSYMWNWIPTVTRTPNQEGLGEVSMLDLMVSSLRMRPDRIIVGEIRRGREAEVLFEAMHTGHSVYSTLHADTGLQVVKRLMEPPISVPKSELSAVNLLVVQHRDRKRNLRRTMEISEVIAVQEEEPNLNIIYHWRPRTDNFDLVHEPRRYIEELNLHTGMTVTEMKEDLNSKRAILGYMLKNKIDSLEKVGAVMKLYYTDPDFVNTAVSKGYAPKRLLEG